MKDNGITRAGAILIRLLVTTISFGTWFLIIGIFDKYYGGIVGALAGIISLLFVNPKIRERRKVCRNANTQPAAKLVEDPKRKEKYTYSKGLSLNENLLN
jgi:hypothetical protein